MRTLLLALWLLALPFAAQAQNAAHSDFNTVAQAQQWIMEYYQNPEPERLATALKLLADTEGITEDGHKLVVSFTGIALRAAPQVHDAFFTTVAESPTARMLAVPSFWFMADDAGRKLLKRARDQWKESRESDLAAQLLQSPPPELLKGPVDSLLHLDHLWSMFYATGAEAPVLKIISTVSGEGEPNLRKQMIGQAAVMSLSANAKLHERVREIVVKTAAGTAEPRKQMLLKIVER